MTQGPRPAVSRRLAAVMTAPVGLAGELMSTAFVRDVTRAANSAGWHWNPRRRVDASAAWIADEVRVYGVTGIREEHFVARVEERGEEQEHGGRGAGRDENLIGRDGDAVASAVVIGDGLAEGQDAQAVGIARAAVLESPLGRLPHHGRRVEVRLAKLEVDDVFALPLELLRALEDLHGQKGLDHLGAAGGHGRLRSRRASRRRARTICPSIRGPSRSTSTFEPG